MLQDYGIIVLRNVAGSGKGNSQFKQIHDNCKWMRIVTGFVLTNVLYGLILIHHMMPRIAALLRNSRNPANTGNPAYLQANLLLAGVWRAKPADSSLHVNMHCYLILAMALSYYFD